MSQIRNRNCMTAQQRFSLRRWIIAVLQSDNFRRSTSLGCLIEKIGIRRHEDKFILPGVLPDNLIGGEMCQASLENVGGAGEQLCEASDKLWREVRVEEQLQRELRSRPVWEA